MFHKDRKGRGFMHVSACQKVLQVWGQTRTEVVHVHVWKIQERGSRTVCLKLKECTNVWEMEESCQNSQFLDTAMVQGSTIWIPVNTGN